MENQKNDNTQPEETEKQKAKRLNKEEQERLLKLRIDTGKAGKLWQIEVLYKVGVETRRHGLENQFSKEVNEFRENIFLRGLMVPVDPGTWVIVPPWNIIDIFVHKQSKYFNSEY